MSLVRVAMVGLGNVGGSFLQLITAKRHLLATQYGLEIQVVAAADSGGAAWSAVGLDPQRLLALKQSGQSAAAYPGAGQPGQTALEMLARIQAECLEPMCLLESSPVNLDHGQPGLDVLRTTLRLGMDAVLANKGPLVLAYQELATLSQVQNRRLRFSATVCSSLPTMNIGRRDLVACQIERMEGIFTSTTNYILTAMAAGKSFAAALQDAQDEGVAETDPSLDIDGWDTANKLVILANSVLGQPTTIRDVSVSGIRGITQQDLLLTRQNGAELKLVALAARLADGSYHLSVEPRVLPAHHPLAQTHGWQMGILYVTDIMGELFARVDERGPLPTAAAMLRDLIDLYCV
ncbi:MAG: homoserine dehydrogenase [Chloroflexi bacterium]|nr:homoserine dehydrogenase [Chloroflexota bacterium]